MRIQERHLTAFTLIAPIVGIIVLTIFVTYLFLSDVKTYQDKDLARKKELITKYKKEMVQYEVHGLVEYIYQQKNAIDKEIENNLKNSYRFIEESLLGLKAQRRSINDIKDILKTFTSVKNTRSLLIYDKNTRKSLINTTSKNDLNKLLKLIKEDSFKEDFLKTQYKKPLLNTVQERAFFIRKIPNTNLFIAISEDVDGFVYETKQKILKKVKSTKYSKDGYFIVIDYEGEVLAHYKDSLIGKDLFDLEKSNQEKIIKDLIKIGRSSSDEFIQYKWEKPSSNSLSDKISYALDIPDWQWVVASGLYLDDLENEIAQETQQNNRELNKLTNHFIFVGFIAILASIGFSIFLSISTRFALKNYKKQVGEKEKELQSLNLALEKRVEEEVTKNREKDLLLLQQSKLAIMGEMLTMISHQWRQPLNSIGLIIQNIQDSYEYGELNKEMLDKETSKTLTHLDEMSDTINHFANFFKPNKEKNRVHVEYIIEKILHISNSKIGEHNIKIATNYNKEEKVTVFENEIIQVALNIVYNAIEEITARGIEQGIISIQAKISQENFTLEISDNAGGIKEEFLTKIYEPYFSTKSKNGTGLGLYMAKMVIEFHMDGTLTAKNNNNGAVFTVTIPKK